jgi:transmembrane sensor
MTDLASPGVGTASPDAMDAIRTRAAEWLVQIEGATDDRERHICAEACRVWRSQDARHEKVFRQMQGLWQSVDAPKPRRKAGGAIASIALALFAWVLLPTEQWLADQKTAAGEIRCVTLADGSTLVLDSGTAVDVHLSDSKREIVLHAGKVLAEVARDTQGRPFVVRGRDGEAKALGTRYIVDQHGADTGVTVLESSVAVSSLKHPDQRVVLQAGEGIRYTADALGTSVPISGVTAEAWTNSRLVFNEAPLPQVIDELSRYRRGVLAIRGAEKLGDLRFTGVLPVDDTDAALSIIAQNLRLQIGQVTPYVVWLEARE